MDKQYPKLWNRIVTYYTLIAKENLAIPEHKVEGFVEKSARNRYRDACNLINHGFFTVQDAEDLFPHPSDK